jgi:hypothetical protein
MNVIERGDSRITILPVIRGLVSESNRVFDAAMRMGPEAIAVSISKEELSAMRNVGNEIDYEMSEIETVYSDLLERFGEVALPPPCFSAALQVSEELGIPILPVDMNEELYSVTYVTLVGTMDLFKESLSIKRLKRKLSRCEDPEEFILEWDALTNRSRGFDRLSSERERHMAGVLARMARRYHDILAIIELERSKGVVWRLESSPSRPLGERGEEQPGESLYTLEEESGP